MIIVVVVVVESKSINALLKIEGTKIHLKPATYRTVPHLIKVAIKYVKVS